VRILLKKKKTKRERKKKKGGRKEGGKWGTEGGREGKKKEGKTYLCRWFAWNTRNFCGSQGKKPSVEGHC
jgi:hypothetical protein